MIEKKVKLSCRNVWKIYGMTPEQFDRSQRQGVNWNARPHESYETGQIVACADVTFDVHAGEIFVIMGLFGSGKSTIIRCISRLVEGTSGQVLLDDVDLLGLSQKELIQCRRHRIGMVFQSFGLLPHLNVIENVAFPLELQGVRRTDRLRRAQNMTDIVGAGQWICAQASDQQRRHRGTSHGCPERCGDQGMAR